MMRSYTNSWCLHTLIQSITEHLIFKGQCKSTIGYFTNEDGAHGEIFDILLHNHTIVSLFFLCVFALYP